MPQLADRLIQPFRELSQAAWESQGSRDGAVLPLCPALGGRQQGGWHYGELKCRVGKGILDTPLSVQSQMPEGGSWEGEGDGAGSLCPGVWGAHGGHSQCWGPSSAWLSLQLSLVSQPRLLIKPGCKWSGDN